MAKPAANIAQIHGARSLGPDLLQREHDQEKRKRRTAPRR